jgi:hypothetical protein
MRNAFRRLCKENKLFLMEVGSPESTHTQFQAGWLGLSFLSFGGHLAPQLSRRPVYQSGYIQQNGQIDLLP